MTEPVFILEQVAIMKKHNFCFFILFLFVACNIEKTTDIVFSQEIIFPADNAVFSENQIINFISQGDFSNPTWISSLDGNLGSGKSIRCKLSIGKHLISIGDVENVPRITVNVKEESAVVGTIRRFVPTQGENEILFSSGSYSGVCISTSAQGQVSTLTVKSVSESRSLMNIDEFDVLPQRTSVRCPKNLFSFPRKSLINNSRNAFCKYSIGDKRVFRVANLQEGTNSTPHIVEAKLVCDTGNVYFWVESGKTITEHDLEILQDALKLQIIPGLKTFFGEWKDLDNDNHVSLLFTEKLNDYGNAIGFFNPSDLFPYETDVKEANYNPTSNEMDILYLGIPDDNRFAFSIKSICATIAHELQHLIHFSLKTFAKYENGDNNPPTEKLFVDEGLAHLAEALCGFGVSGGNIAFVEKFYLSPQNYSLVYEDIFGVDDNTGKRGAVAIFLNWLFEQKGGAIYENTTLVSSGGVDFLRTLVRNTEVGLEGIEVAYGKDIDILLQQWIEELLLIQSKHKPDYMPNYHPISKELVNFPLFAGEIKVSDSISCFINGFGNIKNKNISLLPYSFCFIDNLFFNVKENLILKLDEENRRLSCSFICDTKL